MNLTAIASLGLVAGSVALIGCGGSGGSSNSPLMLPGHDCMTCHTAFTVAGTVFNASGGGEASGVAVVVGGLALTTNAAGNFYTSSLVSFPATVEITVGGRTATMASPAQDGRCNRCHDGVTQPKIAAP